MEPYLTSQGFTLNPLTGSSDVPQSSRPDSDNWSHERKYPLPPLEHWAYSARLLAVMVSLLSLLPSLVSQP